MRSKVYIIRFFVLSFICVNVVPCGVHKEDKQPKPNILIFLADDMGIVDVSCYSQLWCWEMAYFGFSIELIEVVIN